MSILLSWVADLVCQWWRHEGEEEEWQSSQLSRSTSCSHTARTAAHVAIADREKHNCTNYICTLLNTTISKTPCYTSMVVAAIHSTCILYIHMTNLLVHTHTNIYSMYMYACTCTALHKPTDRHIERYEVVNNHHPIIYVCVNILAVLPYMSLYTCESV